MKKISIGLFIFVMCGCSFTTMRTPPSELPQSPKDPVHCTSSYGAPVMDTSIAIATGSAGIAFGYYTSQASSQVTHDYYHNITTTDSSEKTALTAGTITLAMATVLYGASAIYGYNRANKCYDMKEDQRARTEK